MRRGRPPANWSTSAPDTISLGLSTSAGHVARTVPGAYVRFTHMAASPAGKRRFARIDRLPPYVFNITAELKLAARRRGEDIIDMSMGNPDGATPKHIVEKLVEVAQRPDTHGYSSSKGIPRLRRAITHWYKSRYDVDFNP